jgi:hypothetical protein
MASVDYLGIWDAIKTNLTAGMGGTLDSGLSKSVVQVVQGNPYTIPIEVTAYPTVMIQFVNKEEDWESLGGGSSTYAIKKTQLYFDVFALVNAGGNLSSDREAVLLAKNIETLLRADIGLSSTVDFCQPVRCEIGRGELDGVYVSSAVVTLRCDKTIK